MAQLIRDRDTKRRDGRLFSLPVAGGVRIFSGSIVCLNSTGYAVPAMAEGDLKFPALALQTVDNREGADGEALVPTERITVGLDYAVDVTRATIGQTVYLADDHTVTAVATDMSPAGLLVDIQDGQAWVDLTRA